jgi:hypothetical protein
MEEDHEATMAGGAPVESTPERFALAVVERWEGYKSRYKNFKGQTRSY